MALGKPSKKTQKTVSEVPSKSKVSGEKAKARGAKPAVEVAAKEASMEAKSKKKSPAIVNVESAVQDRVVSHPATEAVSDIAASAQTIESRSSADSTTTPSNGLQYANGSHPLARGAAVGSEETHILEPIRATRTVSHEEIAELAYQYWMERGYSHGSADEDWKRAEAELVGRS